MNGTGMKKRGCRAVLTLAAVLALSLSTALAQDADMPAADAGEQAVTVVSEPAPALAQTEEQGVVGQLSGALQTGGRRTVEQGRDVWETVVLTAVQRFVGAIPVFLKAVVFLVAFWIVGSLLGAVVRKLLNKTHVDDRAVRDWGLEGALKRADGSSRSLAGIAGGLVKWLFVLFGFVAFFNALNLAMVAGPLQGVLDKIVGVVPNLLKAALILFIYWAVAAVVRAGVTRLLGAVKIDERIGRHIAAPDGKGTASHSAMIGKLLFYIILLFGVPPFLETLGQQALVEPLQAMLTKVLGFLPNIFAAAIIVVIGRIVAMIVREVVVNVLAAAGADAGAEKIGLGRMLGSNKPSTIVSKIAYFFIFIPIVVAAVDSLGIKTLSDPIKATLEKILAAVPAVLVAIVIVIVGVVVAKVVRSLVEAFLSGIGIDALPERIGLDFLAPKPGQLPLSGVIGAAVSVVILLITAQQATASLQFDQLAGLIRKLVEYLPALVVGLLILLSAMSLSKYVGNLVSRAMGANPNGATLAAVARGAVMVLGVSMALEQLGVGEEIVLVAVGSLLGGAALALGLAFGLGGKDRAREAVERWSKPKA